MELFFVMIDQKMKKYLKLGLFITVAIALICLSVAYVKKLYIPVLEPSGFIAEKEKNLILTSSILMLIVVVPVLLMTVFFAWRYRESNTKAKHTPDWEHNAIAEYFWWGVPFVIILCLAVITWKSSYELSPFKPLASDKKPLKIQAVALQWKWLFFYPEQNIATVNFIKFPQNTPLDFEITADAPMNSFWIPALGGQIYAMPSMRSSLRLIAQKTGTFRGLSANISGTGFAKMSFEATSLSDDDFSSWIDEASNATGFGWGDYNILSQPQTPGEKALYRLSEGTLFEGILMKYMMPQQ